MQYTIEEYERVAAEFDLLPDFHTEGTSEGVNLVYQETKITGFKNTYEAMKFAIDDPMSIRQTSNPFPGLQVTDNKEENNRQIIKMTLCLLERFNYFYEWQSVIDELDSFVYVFSYLYDRDYVIQQLRAKLY